MTGYGYEDPRSIYSKRNRQKVRTRSPKEILVDIKRMVRRVGHYEIQENWWKKTTVGFMLRNFFRPDAYLLLLRAIHGEDEI